MSVVDTDLTDPELYADGFPHELFAELRRAGAVHPHPPVEHRPGVPSMPFWSFVRHAEIQQANRDWQTFSSLGGPTLGPRPEISGHTLVSMDPPDHTAMRRTIVSEFTPRMIARLEDNIAARTAAALEAVSGGAPCDFVRDVAYQVPMHLIADIVGIPEADRAWVFDKTDLLLRAANPYNGFSGEEQLAVQVELFEYAQRLTADKRAHPTDDVWTRLAAQLDGFELEMFFVVLSIAGSETTRNALSQGLVALLDAPDQLAQLRDDPELIGSAADEVIRWSSPVLFFGRTASCDVTIGDQQVRGGDRIVLWYPSGNRDERAFPDPFTFDIRRNPNPHVSFGGGGAHYCLGANLARKEVQVVLGAVAAGYDVEVVGPPEWSAGGPVHNVGVVLERLPVAITPRRGSA